MQVRELISRGRSDVITVPPTAPVELALKRMIDHNVGGLPVVDETERLVGFVSERTIVEALLKQRTDIRVQPIASLMKRPPTCSPDDSVQRVMSRMTRERVRQFVVVEDDRVAGIISVGDIVKRRLDELEMETGVLRDYVAARRATT
jgi:CBS domain-containing protein